jgi:hypothetical protein
MQRLSVGRRLCRWWCDCTAWLVGSCQCFACCVVCAVSIWLLLLIARELREHEQLCWLTQWHTGDCLPGYVEAMGSTLCVPVSVCAHDKRLFWPLFVLAMFLDAVIQLAFVSDVWNPSSARPDATIKCLLYFFQVCRTVVPPC